MSESNLTILKTTATETIEDFKRESNRVARIAASGDYLNNSDFDRLQGANSIAIASEIVLNAIARYGDDIPLILRNLRQNFVSTLKNNDDTKRALFLHKAIELLEAQDN